MSAGPTTARDHEALAELRGITKGFYGKAVLADVDLVLRRGEVHALLGENGAGKSSLCSVLAGLYRPDAGEVFIDGLVRDIHSPQDALAAGVGMVYQHFRLVGRLTVAENLVLGDPSTPRLISKRKLEEEARRAIDEHGLTVPPSARVEDLSVGEQQRVEILKLLRRDVRILILDEPTAVLTPQEAEELFAAVRSMAATDRAIVFVSHKLDEVLALADRITVLRDGRVVGETRAADADPRLLARMLVDRETVPAERRVPVRERRDSAAELVVRELTVSDDRGRVRVQSLSLNVDGGEIMGIAGVAGNGQRELAEALAGLRPIDSGSVQLGSVDVTQASPRERLRRGLAYVPEDRLGVGVSPGRPLDENLVLRTYWRPPLSRGPFLARRQIAKRARDLESAFSIRGGSHGVPARVLSGGNLQRTILARELTSDPAVLIASSPSRGLDVNATEYVWRLLEEQRDRGLAILLISEDLEELLRITDRLAVMFDGRLIGELPTEDADRARLGSLMAGRSSEG